MSSSFYRNNDIPSEVEDANAVYAGPITGSPGVPAFRPLVYADLPSIPVVTSGAAGLAPASGGGTSHYLRADGTWAIAEVDLSDLPYKRVLTADEKFYISPTGSDTTGDGTIGSPWATPQFAFSTVSRTIEPAGYSIVIKYLPGTYTNLPLVIGRGVPLGESPFDAFLEADQSGGWGTGNLYIDGDHYDPGSVILDNSQINIADSNPAGAIQVTGFTFKNSSQAIYITGPGLVYVGSLIFQDVTSSHIEILYGGTFVDYFGTIEIKGNFRSHILVYASASQVRFYPTLLTFTGATATVGNAFISMRGAGSDCVVDIDGGNPASTVGAGTISGSLRKFKVQDNATVTDYYDQIPGSVAGTFLTGGEFLTGLSTGISSRKSLDMLQLFSLTYSRLPAASTAIGSTAHITDCSTSSLGATAAGGGANDVIVRSNGTNWLVMGGGGGGGSPGGSSLTLQYNNASSFGGMSGTSWDDTNRSLTLTGATVTASKPIFDLAQTWNNAAITFSALKLDVTSTASALNSLLVDVRVGGSPMFQVSKEGYVSIGVGIQDGFKLYVKAAAAANADFGFESNGRVVDFFLSTTSVFGLYDATSSFNRFSIDVSSSSSAFAIGASGAFGFSSGSNALSSTVDTFLRRDAANIMAQRNSTTAQALRVYNTFTDSSNYERAVFDWKTTANILTIGTQEAGTGSARDVKLLATNSVYVNLGTSDSFLMQFSIFRGVRDTRVQWSSGQFDVNSADTAISRVTGGVLAVGTGALANADGFIQWGGQKRVTSDFAVTSSTALTNVTGLSVSVQAGRTYTFEAELYVTDAAAGGVQAAIAGTATATAIQYTGYTIADNAIKAKTNATALATAVGSTVTTETAGIVVRITGTITVNAAGTLTVQMAQNTSNGTATTAKRGSYFIVNDMP